MHQIRKRVGASGTLAEVSIFHIAHSDWLQHMVGMNPSGISIVKEGAGREFYKLFGVVAVSAKKP
jgi:hypothetical protein